ncbi:molecular chaperone DnaJ [Actinocorallia sp. A-T 12471]|uniref:molecular chaperone DnaJ n=1 Tax=Actinocorallia sp. A-T 12471 TaxID=3089813 RepID=UPI0029D10344|nr:molecular chaperone DnaJ [Actinocorallia sp. A-T 12471]MDX6744739.1 molecular chaperone DnaJ [Actinocorallia sp. A-T 12471]
MTTAEALALLDLPAAEIFGPDPREARRRYHALARLLHPDTTHPGELRPSSAERCRCGRPGDARPSGPEHGRPFDAQGSADASERERPGDGRGPECGCRAADEGGDAGAFARLTAKWRAYTGGTVLTTRRGAYRVGARVARGDVADLFEVTEDSGAAGLLKLPRDPGDSDLMDRESAALRRIAERGDPRFLPYVPRLVESVRHDGRRGTITSRNEGFHTLAEVAKARPGGLDPRDAAWMWRRLLVALGVAHRAGVVHGAVLPTHVMIHPAEHGLVLVGWGQSVIDPPGRLPLVVDAYATYYPPEAVDPSPAVTAATDIFMATRCMTALVGPLMPAPMRAFARGCAQAAPQRRPADAWALLKEFDELLDRLYGPRVFRPFTL